MIMIMMLIIVLTLIRLIITPILVLIMIMISTLLKNWVPVTHLGMIDLCLMTTTMRMRIVTTLNSQLKKQVNFLHLLILLNYVTAAGITTRGRTVATRTTPGTTMNQERGNVKTIKTWIWANWLWMHYALRVCQLIFVDRWKVLVLMGLL